MTAGTSFSNPLRKPLENSCSSQVCTFRRSVCLCWWYQSSKWDGVVAGVCKLVTWVLFPSYSSWSVALFKLHSFCISIFPSGKAYPPLGRSYPRLPNEASGSQVQSQAGEVASHGEGESFPTGCHGHNQCKGNPRPLHGFFLSLTGAFTRGPPTCQCKSPACHR